MATPYLQPLQTYWEFRQKKSNERLIFSSTFKMWDFNDKVSPSLMYIISYACVQYCNDVMGEGLLNVNICKLPCDRCASFSFSLILYTLPSHLSDKRIDSSSESMKESQTNFRGDLYFWAVVPLEATCPTITLVCIVKNNEIVKKHS